MKKIALACALFGVVGLSAACGGTSQSAECEKFIACAKAVAPTVVLTTYEEDGLCWENDDSAKACTAACTAGNTQYKTQFPQESACQ